MASDVGLGWEVECGGSISRVQKDQPDDQKGGKFLDELYSNGYLFKASQRILYAIPEGMGFMPISSGSAFFYKYSLDAIEDRMQDEFVIQVNGRSVTFVIGYDRKITILDGSNLKIDFVEEDMTGSNILSTISKFIITDELGVKYVFNDKSIQKIISFSGNGSRRAGLTNPATGFLQFISPGVWKETPYYVVNKWELTEIQHPGGVDKINFVYDQYDYRYILSYNGALSYENKSGADRTYSMVANWNIGKSKRLSQIKLPNNSVVNFTYATLERADFPGAKALNRVAIVKDGVEISGNAFSYKYFSGVDYRDYDYAFPSTEIPNARLCLSSISRTGMNGVVDKPYVFDYYNKGTVGGVPGRLLGASDHWGYYTGAAILPWTTDDNYVRNIPYFFDENNRRPASWVSTKQLGMIRSVKYPDGGKMEYIYDHVTYNGTGGNNYSGNGVCVSKVITDDGLQANPAITKEYNYNTVDGKSSLWGYEEPVYVNYVKSHISVPTKGTFNMAGLATDMAYPALKLINFYMQGSAAFATPNAVKIGIYTYLASIAINALIQNFSAPGRQDIDVQTVQYSSGNGQRMNIPTPKFSRVTVYTGTADNNLGKEVFEFTTDKDFPTLYPQDKYSPRPRFMPSFYGIVKRKQVYTKNNEIVSDNYYHYSGAFEEMSDYNNYSVQIDITQSVSCVYADYASQRSNVTGSLRPFYPLVGMPKLDYYIKKTYAGPSSFMVTRTDYSYDKLGNIKKETNTYADGEKIETRYYYPYDYTIPGVLGEMVKKNMINVPISTEDWRLSDGGDKLLGLNIAEMALLDNGDVKLNKSYTLNTKTPLAKSVVGEFNAAVLNRVPAATDMQQQNIYDPMGNQVGGIAGGRMETNVFDDYGNNIIAKVYNAAVNDVAYSSFERDAKGNWDILLNGGGGPQEAAADAPTGAQVLNLNKVQSLKKSKLTATKKYRLTFWKKGGSVNVSSAGNTLVLLEKGAWSLIAVELIGVTDVTLSGNALIDEVRLIPIDAVIKSQTYNSQNLVTSIAGEDNLVQYTEYDNLGIKTLERDADRNIIRTFKSSYKN